MARWLRLLLVLGLLFMPLQVHLASAEEATPEDWQVIRSGIDYQQFHLTSPRAINLFVARMHRGDATTTIDTGIGDGQLVAGYETVRGMAGRYDQAINYWGKQWGNRNDVAIAINGYFFDDKEGTATPYSGVINSGWYTQRYTDTLGDAGFTWQLDRQAFIGKCVYHIPDKQRVGFFDDEEWLDPVHSQKFYGINIQPDPDDPEAEEAILFTPQYGASTGTTGEVLEIVIELTRPALLTQPWLVRGKILSIHENTGNHPLYYDRVVLAAWGTIRGTLKEKIALGEIKEGMAVGVTQEITTCTNEEPIYKYDWTNSYAGLGGDYHFLNAGEIRDDFKNEDATVPNSRTAVGFNGDYVYFVVVDKCDPGVSEGITVNELANFMKYTLGATWGVTLDSGGSSTMVVNQQVVNNTTDNHQVCLGEMEDSFSGNIPEEATLDDYQSEQGDYYEPSVGSSLMMVSVQPIRNSVTFTPTQAINLAANAYLRLGPGENYANVSSLSAGQAGTILPDSKGLNGVLAKNSYWWLVEVNDLTGWIAEQNLVGGVIPPFGEIQNLLRLPQIIKSD